MKKLVLGLTAIFAVITLFGCTPEKKKEKYTEYYFDWFDTVTTITGYEYSKEDFDKVTAEIEAIFTKYHRLYDIYTRYDGVNNLAVVNAKVGGEHIAVPVENEIIELIDFSKEMYHLTGGKFNPAMGSVLSIWHTYREIGLASPEDAELPPMEKLTEAFSHTDIDKIIVNRDEKTVYLADSELTLDVGAVAKGYACEQVAKRLSELGVAGYIINAGGNIRSIGTKPDGEKWAVGIENPDRENEEIPYIAYLSLDGQSLVTSGSYQRFYTVNGKNYHHIIDPQTLMPSERYLSVSVICLDSGIGDVLSTALFNMDISEGSELVGSLQNVEVMWVLPDGEIVYSDGFEKFITPR